jgi:hypothetical protein
MSGWLGYVVFGVAWGLLCVGVRHMALQAGLDMQDIVSQRNEAEARVQALERSVADARTLERIEKVAGGFGFSKPTAAQNVIVPPDGERGLLARLLGRATVAAVPGPAGPEIRSREEVTTTKRVIKKPAGKKKRAGRRDR